MNKLVYINKCISLIGVASWFMALKFWDIISYKQTLWAKAYMRHKPINNCSTIYIVCMEGVLIAIKWINSIRVSSWVIRVSFFWSVITYLNHFNKKTQKNNKQTNKQTNNRELTLGVEMLRRLNKRFHFNQDI